MIGIRNWWCNEKWIQHALKFNPEIIIKIDSDGQMNPNLIPKLLEPILNGSSEFTKGNRFTNLNS